MQSGYPWNQSEGLKVTSGVITVAGSAVDRRSVDASRFDDVRLVERVAAVGSCVS